MVITVITVEAHKGLYAFHPSFLSERAIILHLIIRLYRCPRAYNASLFITLQCLDLNLTM